ncbi:MAG: DnaD domain protein [Lachnospiraceae bacterium]|nr:DnaD domain protein [Lachnospiraceae bacterium]
MALINLYNHNSIDTTAVSNLFIDVYMGEANDAQLKVYLYLLRMLNANLPTSVTDIADKFNHTEKEVLRALKYWEQQQLLDLTFDAHKNLVGIHMHDLVASQHSLRSQSNLSLTSDTDAAAPRVTPARVATVAYEAPRVVDEPTPQVYSKPSYSADRLRAFKQQEDTAQLLFVAESYIGKPLTPAEMKSILFYKEELGFSNDLIDHLLQYCVDRGKKDFKYIDKVAISWKENDITTPQQAEGHVGKYNKNVYAIMNQLGKSNTPTNREMEYITRWIQEYDFPLEVIFEACDRTVMATDKHRFEYAEKILSSWKAANVHKKEDISQMDQMHQRRGRNVKPVPTATADRNNRFNQFRQNDYDFDMLEQELLSN